MDPDPAPAIFDINLQHANKKKKISKKLLILKVHLHHFSKIKSHTDLTISAISLNSVADTVLNRRITSVSVISRKNNYFLQKNHQKTMMWCDSWRLRLCCGSGSSLFGRIRIWIRILPLSRESSKKTLDFYSFWKTDVNVPSKSNKLNKKKNTFDVLILKVTDEKSRIRIRIQIRI
jgi:hypothetical protein